MTTFDIDFGKLITQLLPVRLRKQKTMRWLQCLVAPVIELYSLFIANRTTNLYVLGHNSQITYLQAVLNDMFDPISRRIYIDDGTYTDPLFIYLVGENEPVWMGLVTEIGITTYPNPEWLYTESETISSGNCFIVKVPSSIVFDTYRMRGLVDKYRLPGKGSYSIVLF